MLERSTSARSAGSQAALGQHHRVDAARELAELGGGVGRSSTRLVEQLARLGGVVVDPRARHAQLERELDQPLLGAVMEVALEPSPCLVGGLDDPRPRRAQLRLGSLAVGDVAQVAGEAGGRAGRSA